MKMEGLLTMEEHTKALFKHMKGSSSPGIDGFTVNHLRSLWHDLGHLTKDALNSSFGNKLTNTLQLAVMKLLRKGTKDPTLIGNYRPISLLSIFLKIGFLLHNTEDKNSCKQTYRKATKSLYHPKQYRQCYFKPPQPNETHKKN